MTFTNIIQRLHKTLFLVLIISITANIEINSQNDFNINALKDSLLVNKEQKSHLVKILVDSLLKTTESNEANPILDVLLEFNDDEVIKLMLNNIDLKTDIEAISCDYPIYKKIQEIDNLKIVSIVFNSDFLEGFNVNKKNPSWIYSEFNLDIIADLINYNYQKVNYKYIYNKTKDNTNKKKNLELLIKKLEAKYK